ncbi:MAG: AraC family transcriptional regulator ligand-binding domain-containing protein [Kofleriaceae bacterium]
MFDLPGSYMRDLVELSARWNVAPEALLHGLPITAAALAAPTTRVPLAVCEAIVARAIALTGEPALAFHVGTQMKVSSHGFLGFAAMTASTTREALELATRFASTRTGAIGLALYVEGDTASIVIEERTPLGALREFVVVALIVGLWQLGRELTGRMLDGSAECAFAAPAYVDAIPLGDRLRFGAPSHRLIFDAAILALPLTGADAVATRLAAEQCERELAAVDAGFAGKIRAAIAATATPGLPAIAKQLGMSTRTLKRRLADHGTTFSTIRDDMRRERALLLLDNRALSIGEIAATLGYTELPNFTRAFRNWTGMTPHAYRERRA